MADVLSGSRVRVGPVIGFQNPEAWRIPWPQLYSDSLEFVELAEELGYDDVWLTEHHFADDGYCPALMPVAAAIAARTRRIRIGTKVILLPFHDPVRLAEDASVVDVISNGRLDLGFAAGYRPAEFAGFRIDPAERGARLREALEIVRLAFSGQEFEHEGRFHSYGRIRITPPPVQRPVPLWLGGRSEVAIRRAARLGCHLALADFVVEHSETDVRTYRESLRMEGRDPQQFAIAAVATVFIDEDRERAWRIASPHIAYQQGQYRRWFAEAGDRIGAVVSEDDEPSESVGLMGTPEDVLARIREFHARVPFTHFSFWTFLPGLPARDARRSLELFAQYVLPGVRALRSEPDETGHK